MSVEPWLDKRGIAAHYACSVRWIELRIADGLPCWQIAGRAKFKLSETDPWLTHRGYIERGPASGCTLDVTGSTSGPRDAQTSGGLDTRSKPHANTEA